MAGNSDQSRDTFVGEHVELVHHEPRKRQVRSANMQLNLTSMIDVIFLLLIYFVVTASFAVGEGVITGRMPEGSGPSEALLDSPKTRLYIELESGSSPNEYRLNIRGNPRQPRNFRELSAALAEMLRAQEASDEDPVIIQPGQHVAWQHALNAYNAAVSARYKDVRFGQPE